MSTIVYLKGSEIVFADHLSRNLNTKSDTWKITELDKFSIANVDVNVIQVKLNEIQDKSKLDPELIQVSKFNGAWMARQTDWCVWISKTILELQRWT